MIMLPTARASVLRSKIVSNADSFDFDGVNDYGYVPHATDFNFNNGSNDVAASFAFWVKPKTGYTKAYCMAKNASYTTGEWWIRIDPTVGVWFRLIDTSVGSAGDTRMNIKGGTITTNTWNHVAVTYDGSAVNTGMEIYVNGSIVASPTRSNDGGTYSMTQSNTDQIHVGRVTTIYSPMYIDEMYIWKGAELSSTEISYLYGLYSSGVAPDMSFSHGSYTSASSLVGGWSTNNGSGDFADITTNNRKMTRIGGALSSDIPPP